MTSTLDRDFPGSGDAARLTPVTRSNGSAVSAAAVSSAAGAALAAEEVTQMLGARFPVEVAGGVPVVAAPEEIDITNADALRSALLEVTAHGHGTLVADMTRTRFCDSSGLHALLAVHKRAQAQGGELLLVIPSAAVLRVLAITCIDRMIPNFTSLEEALAQTSANGSNGHRRADAPPEGSEQNRLAV